MESTKGIMENALFGIRITKECLKMSLDVPGLRRHTETENRPQVSCALTEDFEGCVMALREKRDLVYRDR
ncbi:MAG: hypothetical protein ACUVXD_16155 [Thermodesulfobacteriota bacterium]